MLCSALYCTLYGFVDSETRPLALVTQTRSHQLQLKIEITLSFNNRFPFHYQYMHNTYKVDPIYIHASCISWCEIGNGYTLSTHVKSEIVLLVKSRCPYLTSGGWRCRDQSSRVKSRSEFRSISRAAPFQLSVHHPMHLESILILNKESRQLSSNVVYRI